jgi:phosphatidyl-myo-inositol dimannoside synthase
VKPVALVVTPNLPPATGGIESLLGSIVPAWDRVDPVVIAPDGPGAAEFDRDWDVPVVRVSRGRGPRSTAALLNAALLAHGRRRRPAVVLSGHIVASPAAWAFSRVAGAPYVQYVYGRELARRPRLSRFALERATSSIAISAYTERLAASVAPAGSPMHRIPPCAHLEVHPRGGDRQPEIVAVARLVERSKGHDVLLAAMPDVLRAVPEARLTIVGDGPLRAELQATAANLGIAGEVEFLGAVDEATRDAVLARAAVFALPTRLDRDGGGEGFGIVYLEAAAYGLPSVAGRAGGAVDAVVDGKTGVFVDPLDAQEVARAIVELLRDPARAARLGAAGAARLSEFSCGRVARLVEDVLLDATGGH